MPHSPLPPSLADLMLLVLSAVAPLAAGCVRTGPPEAGGPFEYLYIEAETGALTAPFRRVDDPTASGGRYVLDDGPLGTTSAGAERVTFTLPHTASWFLWGRFRATTESSDSFFVAIDGGQEAIFHAAAGVYPSDWQWRVLGIAVGIGAQVTPSEIPLLAGSHRLELRSREAQSMVDQLLFTDDRAFVP